MLLLQAPVPAQELFEGTDEGIPPRLERLYVRGLDFLVKTQMPEGNWPDTHGKQPGVVGLAILSMMAHGDDPQSGPYSRPIRQGLDFILTQMDRRTGYIGNSMYNHGFATLALAEAYGMVDDPRLGPALKQAVDLILTSQARNPQGAWRYSPESVDADTTVSGAQVVALFAARNAGIKVPDDAIEKALRFFRRCQGADGGFGYTSAGGSNGPRTAIGVLVLALAKQKSTAEFEAAFRFLQETGHNENMYYHYYLYYASQAFFQAQPEAWEEWNQKNIISLEVSQNQDGGWDGPFQATFSTSASLLSLALNYRYLPIYER
jgi:hypothetical protein